MAAAMMWLMFTLGCFLAPQGEQCSAVGVLVIPKTPKQ